MSKIARTNEHLKIALEDMNVENRTDGCCKQYFNDSVGRTYTTFNGYGNSVGYFNGDSVGYNFRSGNAITLGDGNSRGKVALHYFDLLTVDCMSKVDPIRLDPLTFSVQGVNKTWDEVWDLSTEEEKLVLIQWMNIR
jgi:hypothetical protein